MSSEVIDAPLGTPHPDASPRDVNRGESPEPAKHEERPNAPVLPYSGSGDDLGLALSAKPDPLLGEFDPEAPLPPPPVADSALDSEAPRSSAELDALEAEKPLPLQPFQPPGSFDAVGTPPQGASTAPAKAAGESPVRNAIDRVSNNPLTLSSFDDLSGLKMSSGPPSVPANEAAEAFEGIDMSAPSPTASSAKTSEEDEDEEDDDEYEDEPQGSSLAFVLLLSYASAVTIGLAYVLWTGKSIWHKEESDFLPPVDERVDPGQRAKFSRRVAPPPLIAAEHITTLGKPLTIGALEITPVAITSGPIVLKHMIGGNETKVEGSDALKLRFKLRNMSKDLVFAPFDESFLREREAGVTDSFIELPQDANIEMFPLAVTSEWAIVGQEFKELKPGETLDTQVVSSKDALSRKAPEMTWRVRVRTGIDSTQYLGVRFSEREIKPGS